MPQIMLGVGTPNAGRQLLPEAGARNERTLEAVSSIPLFGMVWARIPALPHSEL